MTDDVHVARAAETFEALSAGSLFSTRTRLWGRREVVAVTGQRGSLALCRRLVGDVHAGRTAGTGAGAHIADGLPATGSVRTTDTAARPSPAATLIGFESIPPSSRTVGVAKSSTTTTPGSASRSVITTPCSRKMIKYPLILSRRVLDFVLTGWSTEEQLGVIRVASAGRCRPPTGHVIPVRMLPWPEFRSNDRYAGPR